MTRKGLWPGKDEPELELSGEEKDVAVEKLQRHPLQEMFPPLSDAEFEALKADIKRNGIKTPVTITKSCVLLAGHNRVRALQQLGESRVPCVVASFETEAAEQAYAVADNLLRRQVTASERAALATHIDLDSGARGILQVPAGKQRRDVVGGCVGVSGRLISDAQFCWKHKESEMRLMLARKLRTTVSKLAREIRRASRPQAGLVKLPKIANQTPGVVSASLRGAKRTSSELQFVWELTGGGFLVERFSLAKAVEDAIPADTAAAKALAELGAGADVGALVNREYDLLLEVGRGTKVVRRTPQRSV